VDAVVPCDVDVASLHAHRDDGVPVYSAVRSGLITSMNHRGRSSLNSRLAATSSAPVSVEWIIGESQKNR
jgi:hypothetical protein